MTHYLHSMIRVSDPAATIALFDIVGLKEVRRMDNEQARFSLIFLAAPGQEGIAEIELPITGMKAAISVGAISATSPSGSRISTIPARV